MPNRVEAVPVGQFLNRDNIIRSEEQADLFGGEVAIARGHADDDEQMVVVLFDLGSLVDMDRVLQGQRMQVKDFAHRLQPAGVRDAVDVDPQDRVGLTQSRNFVRGFQVAFEQVGGRVTNGRYADAGM